MSAEAAGRALVEWLDAVPANKIMAFGGDDCFVDVVYDETADAYSFELSEELLEAPGVLDHPHPLSSPSGGGLDHHREADAELLHHPARLGAAAADGHADDAEVVALGLLRVRGIPILLCIGLWQERFRW